MNVINKFDAWLDTLYPPAWLDFIRIILGTFIFIKGFIFTSNFELLANNVASIGWFFLAAHAAYYVSFTHLFGGALIALGCYTRSMSLANIPILAGAVVFEYQHFLTVQNHMNLDMAIIVLVGLVLFFFYGGGRFSIDELRRRDNQRKKEMAHG